MNKLNVVLTKEFYDNWDRSHPFWRFTDFPGYSKAKETCPFLPDGILAREENILCYVWHSLTERQEYDAGNAILLAAQTGQLSDESIVNIASYVVSNNVHFNSKIGKTCFIGISRSFGLWLFMSGRKDLGQRLWETGIAMTKSMANGKDHQIQRWQKLSENESSPVELKILIDAFI
jgi:hypothetical protein